MDSTISKKFMIHESLKNFITEVKQAIINK